MLAPADVIRLERDAVVLLDQTRLPGERVDRRCTTVAEVCAAIRELAIRGAPAIGIAAAMGMAQVARSSAAADTPALRRELAEARAQLAGSRPTAINLGWALDRCDEVIAATTGPPDELSAALATLARRIHDDEVARCLAMGRHGAELLPRARGCSPIATRARSQRADMARRSAWCARPMRAIPGCMSGWTRRAPCCRARA